MTSRSMALRLACVVTCLCGVAACSSSSDDEAVTSNSISPSSSSATSTSAPVGNISTEADTVVDGALPLPTYVIQAGNDNPPPFPTAVDGYVLDGAVQSGEVRVSGGQATSGGTSEAAGHCEASYWIARWRTLGSDPILATPSTPSTWSNDYVGVAVESVLSDALDRGAPIGTSGYLTGYGCERPVFGFPPSLNVPANLFTDITIEVQRYRPGVDTSGSPIPEPTIGEPTAPPGPVKSCDAYNFSFDLPFQLCDEGTFVGYIQQQLSVQGHDVDLDERYGPETVAAVADFQTAQGLIPDGIVGARTWRLLMADAGLPGQDLDGDGTLTPNELILD